MQQKLMQTLPSPTRDSSPSLGLLATEPFRAAFEYASMRCMDTTGLARGDGHAVVIFPGLGTDRHATAPLRRFCKDLGYEALDWGQGLNRGPSGDVARWLEGLAAKVDQMTQAHSGPISLIGWSLGGIYAREVAKLLPQRVRRVLTIGSPFAGGAEQSNVGLIYRLLNGRAADLDEALRQQLLAPPPVPTTSIFSRSDGIVAWQACVQDGQHRHVENIEVQGSHCGLAWNPASLEIIASRLALG